jgi:hypothetical protein
MDEGDAKRWAAQLRGSTGRVLGGEARRGEVEVEVMVKVMVKVPRSPKRCEGRDREETMISKASSRGAVGMMPSVRECERERGVCVVYRTARSNQRTLTGSLTLGSFRLPRPRSAEVPMLVE